MLRKLFEILARTKNPGFRLPENAGSGFLFMLMTFMLAEWLRGLRMIFAARYPITLFFGCGVRVIRSSSISFGRNNRIGRYCQLSGWGSEGILFGDNVWIGAFSTIHVSISLEDPSGYINIGNNVGIGEYAHLGGAGGLAIGDDCIIGPYLSCHPENHKFEDNSMPIRKQGVTRKGIRIGNNCWIGAKVTVLDGVNIGDHCVIAAGAVVTKSLPSGCVAAGVPARIIRMRTQNDIMNKSSIAA